MNRAPLTYHQIFLEATSRKLRDLRARVAQKENKAGRVTRVGREVPFDLDTFRGWVLEKFKDEAGHCPCYYCGRLLTAGDFVLDHVWPLSRGGSLALDNCCVSCQRCNDIKGATSGQWFQFFMRCLDQMPDPERADIEQRLQSQVKLAQNHKRSVALRMKGQQPAKLTEEKPIG